MKLGIIPARAGSKRIKNKNVKELGGIPLVCHTIRAAVESDLDYTVMSTESEIYEYLIKNWVYQRLGKEAFNRFDVIRRPSALALDFVQSDEVALYVMRQLQDLGYNPQTIVQLQPTSPFRTSQHINEALELYESDESQYKTVISGCYVDGFYWQESVSVKGMVHLEENPRYRLGTQWAPRAFRENGAIYITSAETLAITKSKFTPPYLPYEMSREDSIDIDTEEDWQQAERIYRERFGEPSD